MKTDLRGECIRLEIPISTLAALVGVSAPFMSRIVRGQLVRPDLEESTANILRSIRRLHELFPFAPCSHNVNRLRRLIADLEAGRFSAYEELAVLTKRQEYAQVERNRNV